MGALSRALGLLEGALARRPPGGPAPARSPRGRRPASGARGRGGWAPGAPLARSPGGAPAGAPAGLRRGVKAPPPPPPPAGRRARRAPGRGPAARALSPSCSSSSFPSAALSLLEDGMASARKTGERMLAAEDASRDGARAPGDDSNQ